MYHIIPIAFPAGFPGEYLVGLEETHYNFLMDASRLSTDVDQVLGNSLELTLGVTWNSCKTLHTFSTDSLLIS